MTQISAGHECHTTACQVDGAFDTRSKTQMIVIRQKRIAESNDLSVPAILKQKIERYRSPVIQLNVGDPRYLIVLIVARGDDIVQEIFIDLEIDLRLWRSEARKTTGRSRSVINNKRIFQQRRMR